MVYEQLDSFQSIPALTLAFRFTDQSSDPWTSRLNEWKVGNAAAVRGACAAVTSALATLPLRRPVTLVAAIPSSQATLPPNAPVAVLGQKISAVFGFTWAPHLLSKRPHRSLHSLTNSAEREAEVQNAYTAAAGVPATGTVLIIDDLVTRGSTFGAIATALRTRSQGISIVGLAPGKTERTAYWHGIGRPISNAHVPVELADAWDKA